VKIQVTLCLPRDAGTVSIVRAIAVDTLRLLSVTPACVDDIRVALSEACTNVIQHAVTTEDYEVRLEVDGDQCVLAVIDAGQGADETTASDAEMPAPWSPTGRGLALMRALSDRIDFTSAPDAGTTVRLVRGLEFEQPSPLGSSR